MEIIIIAALFIVVLAIIMTDHRPTQPSFIITPMTDEHIRHSNDGCLILAILAIGVVFIVTVSTM